MPVYELALRSLELCRGFSPALRRGHRHLDDQLQGAAVSIVANIGEGATDLSPGDKRRFYRYALRSAGECAALLQAAQRLTILPPETVAASQALLKDLRAQLFRLHHSIREAPRR
jgi:four helix bundle protein